MIDDAGLSINDTLEDSHVLQPWKVSDAATMDSSTIINDYWGNWSIIIIDAADWLLYWGNCQRRDLEESASRSTNSISSDQTSTFINVDEFINDQSFIQK